MSESLAIYLAVGIVALVVVVAVGAWLIDGKDEPRISRPAPPTRLPSTLREAIEPSLFYRDFPTDHLPVHPFSGIGMSVSEYRDATRAHFGLPPYPFTERDDNTQAQALALSPAPTAEEVEALRAQLLKLQKSVGHRPHLVHVIPPTKLERLAPAEPIRCGFCGHKSPVDALQCRVCGAPL